MNMKWVFLLPALLLISASAQAKGKVILQCEPQEIKPFPENAKVSINAAGANLIMIVTTSFYGVDLDEKYQVAKVGDSFIGGEDVKLTLSSQTSEKGIAAQLDSKKDGQILLNCR